METDPVKPLSEAIADPLVTTFRAGGWALALLFLGVLLLLVAIFFGQGTVGFLIAVVGVGLLAFALWYIYVKDVKDLVKAHKQYSDNKKLIDTVQQVAVLLTELSFELKSFAFKNCQQLSTTLNQVRELVRLLNSLPILSRVPGVGDLNEIANSARAIEAADLSTTIVELSDSVNRVISNVRTALVEAKPKLLEQYVQQLQEAKTSMKKLLTA